MVQDSKEASMLRSLLGRDWRRSEAHLLLLTKCIRGRTLEEFAKWESWEGVLGETPQKAIRRFMDEGMLVSPGLPEHVAYKYKVSELQAMLKQRSLPVSGHKDQLISMLIEADPAAMKKAVAGLTVLLCSDRGQEIANEYLVVEERKKETTEQEVLTMLQKRKFREASLLVASYNAKQVFPPGMGIDWKNYDPDSWHPSPVAVLRIMFESRPKVLERLGQDKLGPLRLAAGMMDLWSTGTDRIASWLPPGFQTGLAIDNGTAVRMMLSYALHQANLEDYRKSGVVKTVKILTCNDDHVCEACRKLASKTYKLSEVPELPYEKCTSEHGCRCWASGQVNMSR